MRTLGLRVRMATYRWKTALLHRGGGIASSAGITLRAACESGACVQPEIKPGQHGGGSHDERDYR